jgi:hypothetical protein
MPALHSHTDQKLVLDDLVEAVALRRRLLGGHQRTDIQRVEQFHQLPPLTTEEGRGEARQRESLCPLIWSVHHNLARAGYIESTKIFRHGNKNTLFLVMIYSALFNYVFKALKLF